VQASVSSQELPSGKVTCEPGTGAGWPLLSGLMVAGKLGCFTNIRFTEDMTEISLADFKPQ
jgi:hypothetical protein